MKVDTSNLSCMSTSYASTSNSLNDTILPTAKEYKATINKTAFEFTAKWSEPKYQCPECGGGMCKDLMTVCTSLPPQYKYQCDKCGHVDYQLK